MAISINGSKNHHVVTRGTLLMPPEQVRNPWRLGLRHCCLQCKGSREGSWQISNGICSCFFWLVVSSPNMKVIEAHQGLTKSQPTMNIDRNSTLPVMWSIQLYMPAGVSLSLPQCHDSFTHKIQQFLLGDRSLNSDRKSFGTSAIPKLIRLIAASLATLLETAWKWTSPYA